MSDTERLETRRAVSCARWSAGAVADGPETSCTRSGSTGSVAEPKTFVDTNILVCAHDGRDPRKQRIARIVLTQLWDDRSGIVSTQVLQEFYVVASAPQKLGMPASQARELIELYSTWPVVLIEPALVLNASRLHERQSVSFWDA